jgi:hypothetical protein
MNLHFKKPHVCLLALVLLSLIGCGPKQPPPPTALDIGGVKVDMPKLQAEFVNASPELLDSVHQASAGLRYGQYEKCLQALDKLVNSPGLSESQKKVTTDVIEQMKQVIAKAGPNRQ